MGFRGLWGLWGKPPMIAQRRCGKRIARMLWAEGLAGGGETHYNTESLTPDAAGLEYNTHRVRVPRAMRYGQVVGITLT